MSDQPKRNLESEARRFVHINKLLPQDSSQWQVLHVIFVDLQKAYPPQIKGGVLGLGGEVKTPPSLESWVSLTAEGHKPRPDGDDMRKMQIEEQRHPKGPETAFYRRWVRLIDETEAIARTIGAPASDGSGPGGMPPAVPVGTNETRNAQPIAAAPTTPAQTAPASASNGGQRASPASQTVQASRNTVELPAIQPILNPVSHKGKFDTLHSAAGLMMTQRETFRAQLAAMQQWVEQYWRDSGQLDSAAQLVVNTDWISPEDYRTLRLRHDALDEQNRLLTERTQLFQQEAQRLAKEREDARLHTADLLIKQARGLWKQFNMRAETEKRLSEHDQSLTKQVYNDLLRTLDTACAVEALDVRANDRFDPAKMEEIVTQVRTREKDLRGCVAWVEEPGFRDEKGAVWPAKVAVYSGE